MKIILQKKNSSEIAIWMISLFWTCSSYQYDMNRSCRHFIQNVGSKTIDTSISPTNTPDGKWLPLQIIPFSLWFPSGYACNSGLDDAINSHLKLTTRLVDIYYLRNEDVTLVGYFYDIYWYGREKGSKILKQKFSKAFSFEEQKSFIVNILYCYIVLMFFSYPEKTMVIIFSSGYQ